MDWRVSSSWLRFLLRNLNAANVPHVILIKNNNKLRIKLWSGASLKAMFYSPQSHTAT
jgi:hypothetical protein